MRSVQGCGLSIRRLCSLFDLSVSGYYSAKQRKPSSRNRSNTVLLTRIRTIHQTSYETYGYRRIRAELLAQGYSCSKKRVLRLMRKDGIQSVHRKRYRPQTTDSSHDLPIASNVIKQRILQQKLRTQSGGLILVIFQRLKVLYT